MPEPSVSVLVVTALPDERQSSAELELFLADLRAQRGVQATVWYLRQLDHQTVPADRHVVDSLRTSPGLPQLDRVGAGVVANAVRGRILRRACRRW